MDSKNRKNLDVKYLHPFSPAPSHNGHRHSGSGAEGNKKTKPRIHEFKVLQNVF